MTAEKSPKRENDGCMVVCQPFVRGLRTYICVDGGGEVGSGGSGDAEGSKRTQAREQQEQKKRDLAARMAPRPCQLTTCQKMFVPKRPQDWKSAFCCKEHQKEFWIEANRLSAAVIKAGDLPLSIRSEYRQGVPHTTQVLDILNWNAGEWVSLRKTLPEINPNVVSKLRQMGYEIEMREVGERPYTVSHEYRPNWRRFAPGGKVEYQYRLVK